MAFKTIDDAAISASFREIEDWRAATTTFAGIAAYSTTGPISMRLDDGSGSPDVFFGAYVSAGAFRLLGETPRLGRDLVPDDDRPGAPAVVLLGYTIWTSRYGGDPAVVGRTIRINGTPRAVIGVMPEGFRFPINFELWLPLMSMPGIETERRDVRQLQAFGRLAAGATMAQAQAEMTTVAARLSLDYPATNRDVRPLVRPFTGVPSRLFVALLADVAAYRFRPLDVWAGQSRAMYRVFGSMFAIFAWMALALSAIGLYAVTSHAVTQRIQEIGVRIALGAQAGQVVWLFVRRGITPLAIGLVIGMGGAFGAGRLVRSLLVDTGAAIEPAR